MKMLALALPLLLTGCFCTAPVIPSQFQIDPPPAEMLRSPDRLPPIPIDIIPSNEGTMRT